MRSQTAQRIIKETQEVYSHIAQEFHTSRSSLWPEFDVFLKYIHPHDKILDIGCGNGRLVNLFKETPIDYTGLDNNKKLLDFALKNYPDKNFVLGDILKLPFQDTLFDKIFMIAALHHIPSKSLRDLALRQAFGVLKPGGVFIVTNWYRYTLPYFFIIAKYTLLKLLGISPLDFKDIYLPWSHSEFVRYYHCYTLGELKRDIIWAGFQILESYVSSDAHGKSVQKNLVVIAKK